jgi:uncharacterized protein YlzI (FlbEa/FlbD family)
MGEGHVYINEQYIESIDETPDSTIKLHDGTTYVVQEKADAILKLIVEWEKKINGKR